jgi:uncharacterized SAM-binding protein YcdF (DUF218 family)
MILVGVLLWIGILQWRMAAFPDNPEARGDVGIVLGSSLKGELPSPSLKERLDRAVTLYAEGRIPQIIVSGGYDRKDSKLTEAEGMRNYLIQRSIPSKAIILENQATSTYENLLYSQSLMQQQGWRSAVIITHRYHMVRAMEIADFLNYEHPEASPVDSEVLFLAWQKSRETASFVKWYIEKLMIIMGMR